MVQFDSLVYGAFTRRFRRGVGGTVGRNWAGRNLDIIQGMEMRRYRNGSHQVRVNVPRPFRRARRVTKNDQRFVYNGYLQIADNSGNTYIWDCTENVATRPLAWQRGTSVAYYTHDGNKNVSEVIASNNDVAAHYEYAPFGALTVLRGGSAEVNPWHFSSEFSDDEIGCVYYNYRHYEPTKGRWLNRDVLMEEAERCLYLFCGNDPSCNIDVQGCYPQWINEIVKEIGYRAWKSVMLSGSAWEEMIDNWYYERGPKHFVDGDPRVEDIKNNIGFAKLVNCSVAAKAGVDVSKELLKCSSATVATPNRFYWHYAYPGAGKPAAGRLAAYDSAANFLGSFGGGLLLIAGEPGKPGKCKYKVTIKNVSGWTSATRLPGFASKIGVEMKTHLPAWIGLSRWDPVSLFKNHGRSRHDLYPISGRSKGGNYEQTYHFIYEADCCAKCELP